MSERVYLWPPEWVMNAVLDVVELQKGEVTFSGENVIQYSIGMYGKRHDYKITLTGVPRNRCRVKISENGASSIQSLLIVQFAILESLMLAFSV
jgi:hypothetical protein